MGTESLTQSAQSEIVELTTDVSSSPYYSHDMAPTPRAERRWGMWDMAALWVSMSACIPTYMMASSLIDGGMNWWQAILTILLANVIVLIPMVLNAHAGTRYGIPFPVYCRAPFGLYGANVPAMLRALVACGWFGIQTWIGGAAIYKILKIYVPSLGDAYVITWLDKKNIAELGCFLFFWAINMFVIFRGIESIRILLNIKAPLLILLGLALLAWAYFSAGGFGEMLSQHSQFSAGQPKAGQFWGFFAAALTANVAFWATLSLNIPDFSRYAYSQRDQVLGQTIGLPTTMTLYSFIGVAVTSAAFVIYHDRSDEFKKGLWDPVNLLSQFQNPIVLTVALFALCLATLATNIAANVVSPANDFAHLWPRKIDFRTGGLITGIIGIAIRPWRLLADPSGYIFTWLIAYSALLGSVGGILIADYFLVRKRQLNLAELYRQGGAYWYQDGINWLAMAALFVGVLPCVPGFLTVINFYNFGPFWKEAYNYAWFLSFGISFVVYAVLMQLFGSKLAAASAAAAETEARIMRSEDD
jgi:NCS1 family nucleobase:cation symporter-1